jgi:tryptophanyl-tRNA synthetase
MVMITPWEVKGSVDYDKLIKEFGVQPITPHLKQALSDHVLIRRNFFFAHRELDVALEELKKGEVFVYTGRGPSGPMHVGHLVPFLLALDLQQRYGVPVIIEMTDDEKFAVKRDITWDEVEHWTHENVLDIIALGFDPDNTFIFRDSEYVRHVYPLLLRIGKHINWSTAKAVFGFKGDTNVSLIFYPTYQLAPTFFFPGKRALIPCAIDQDPYWRLQHDVAHKFKAKKAAIIHSKFLPPLTGLEGKMSSSSPDTSVWLSDPPAVVRRKIFKYAFSGGQPTVELHRKLGGNPDVDVSFQWLKVFLEPDDQRLARIEQAYRSGEMLSGELKSVVIEKLNALLERLRENRERMRDAVKDFMYEGKLAQQMWETYYK